MTTVTLPYPDEHRDRIIDAVCSRFGYRETVDVDGDAVPNPQTQAQFVAERLAGWVRSQVRQYETEKAANEADEIISAEVAAIDVSID